MTKEIRNFKIAEYRFVQSETAGEDQATETRAPRLEGYAIVWNSDSVLMWDRGEEFIERMAPGSCKRSLAGVANGEHIVAFWSHDTSKPLASTRNGNLILTEDAHGLHFSMSLERMDPMMLAAARDGDVQVSFGMISRDDDWSRRGDGTRVRTITDIDLFEISPVVFPAYPATEAAVRSYDKWEASQITEEAAVEEIEEESEGDETRADYTIQLALVRLKKSRLKSKLA